MGPRLQSVLREGDTVARLGGDEFAVLLPLVDGVGEAEAVAERLREALHRPFDVDGVALDVEASIGIALSPWHGTDTEELLRNADIAMYVGQGAQGRRRGLRARGARHRAVAAHRPRRPAPRAGRHRASCS